MNLASQGIRFRLAAWSTGALAVVLAVLGIAVGAAFDSALERQGRRSLDDAFARIEALLVDEIDDANGTHDVAAELNEESGTPWFAVRVGDGELIESDEWRVIAPPAWRAALTSARVGAPDTEQELTLNGGSGPFRARVGARQIAGQTVSFAVALDESALHSSRRAFMVVAWTAAPLGLLVAFVAGLLLAGRLLAPVRALAERAEHIDAQNLSERLTANGTGDEFDRVASSFNRVLDRLEEAFTRLRRFTSDASHQLRTPLTAMRAVAEVALADRENPAHWKDSLCSVLEEIESMTALIDRLLTLTRANSGSYIARFESVDIATLVKSAAQTMEPIADERGIDLACFADSIAHARADEATLRQALLNLLDNALAFAPRGGIVRTSVHCRNDVVCVEIADSGPGIPLADRERVFERFVQLKTARASEARPGAGLGLAIAKWAIELSGGRLEAEQAPEGGALLRVSLPLEGLGSPDQSRQRERQASRADLAR